MSIRVYRAGPYGQRRSRQWIGRSAWIITLAVIAAQIAYPLAEGERLRQLTIFTVLLAAVAIAVQSWATYGPRYSLTYLAITAPFALMIETIGVHTGWPFGEYEYATTLGRSFFDVPLVVPLAWVMMAHPVLVAARRLSQRWAIFLGGFGLMAWDVFLDPMMVEAGHWSWERATPALWGVPGIPLSNFFGWLLSGVILMAILHTVLPTERRAEPASNMPAATFLLWTYFSSVIGSLFFFDRAGVALTGGLLMGAIVLPYAATLWWSRQ
jgi:uncharacterized membrane protein